MESGEGVGVVVGECELLFPVVEGWGLVGLRDWSWSLVYVKCTVFLAE